MDDLTKQDALELEVANFGPIVEAKIDLRPLTVFVGPSNTGKSYLAILIYALHRFFSGFRDYRMFRGDGDQKLSQAAIKDLAEWAQQVSGDKKVEESLVLSPPVIDVIPPALDARGDQLVKEIDRCFGIDEASALTRKGNKDGARVVFRKHVFEHKLTFKAQGAEFGTTTLPGRSMEIDVVKDAWRMSFLRYTVENILPAYQSDKEQNSEELAENLVALVLSQLGTLYGPAFYLPADRTGVMHAHSVVVSAIIGSAPMTGLRPATGTPMLSGVLADFLQQLIELDRRPRRRVSRRNLGTQIEEAILDGAIRVDRSEMIGYPHFTYRPRGWKNSLPLMNTSSMVSELAPVVLYLRHVVRPGETLIIEEPEAHLHPAMQVEFTRQIAALVHAGVRVIVTTHSEWVLEELANIVQRSKLPKARRKEIPQGDFALRSDQVGAWLFKQKLRPKGAVVEEVKLDAETGLYPTDYDAVSAALYNESVSIFNRIEDSAAE